MLTKSDLADGIVQSIGVDLSSSRPTSLSFSFKKAPKSWKAFSFDTLFPLYKINAPGANVTDIRTFINGIQAETYIVIVQLYDITVLCMRRPKKGEEPSILLVRSDEDYEKMAHILRKHNFVTDELSAWAAIDSSIELLKSGGERYFVNRGLFSSYYLRERLDKALSERKRDTAKEAQSFFSRFPLGIPLDSKEIPKVLVALGYSISRKDDEYTLDSDFGQIHAAAIVVDVDNLDIKPNDDNPVPSVEAVAALSRYPWIILTNGKSWRLYSSRVSSASTNYFEVDLDGVTDQKDPRLKYFVSLFSVAAFIPKQGDITDLDYIFNGGQTYAKELEEDLREKVFEKQLFLDLVKGVIHHSISKKYSEDLLEEAKKKGLKLLYRLLFILYAESRLLLPIQHPGYKDISITSLRERLSGMEKESNSTSAWNILASLFSSISNGNPVANLPQYNGSLFEFDESLDTLQIMNKHLIPPIRALTEVAGKGIDYQSFGVRQLGSLYESLLEYSVMQAENDLVVIKDEILDFSFASDLKTKPSKIIEKGDLYLSVGGLARKGTGSYYTPDKIVKFLVQKGLKPILEDRQNKFIETLTQWRNKKTKELANNCTQHLLDIQVVDPAMGSGHFLVAAVDEITRWIISLLQKYPDAPLATQIGEDRLKIISEQMKKGIHLDEDLLTFNVILKRKVMKRCVFGVDINPLAVELAKVSLWLDSFTLGTPLTFLDHHIRCGDSLIGSWLSNLNENKQDMTLDIWIDNVIDMGQFLHSISLPADLTLDEFKKNRESYLEFRKKSKPLRVILDMLTAAIIDNKLKKDIPHNLKVIEKAIINDNVKNEQWYNSYLKCEDYSEEYLFFHWELEFPDAFTDEKRGFDLVITNPPWAQVRLYDDDFFSQYKHQFRSMSTKKEKLKLKNEILKNPSISLKFKKSTESVQKKKQFSQL